MPDFICNGSYGAEVETTYNVVYRCGRKNQIRRTSKKVVGITATMLTKCLRELENDGLIKRKQYQTIPPTVEYSYTLKGRELIESLDGLYKWAKKHMN